MNGAEFQCAREYLGLSAVWVADRLGVDRRTVYRWEQGKTRLPDDAAAMMGEWVQRTSMAVGKLTVAIHLEPSELLVATPDEGFEHMAVEGFPASWQRMVRARVAERTDRQIVWMSKESAAFNGLRLLGDKEFGQ